MQLIATEEFGIKGTNYYLTKKTKYNITDKELVTLGINDKRALVRPELKAPLCKANEKFRQDGYELFVKEGYRDPKIYKLAQTKRYQLHGKEATDRSLNVKKMPHATGFVVDIALLSRTSNQEIEMRDKKDGTKAFFIDYYIGGGKHHPLAKVYQQRQQYLIKVMCGVGFSLGSLREYWHFEWLNK